MQPGRRRRRRPPAGRRFPALILALRWATVTTGAVLSLLDLARLGDGDGGHSRCSASTPASGSSGPSPAPEGARRRPAASPSNWPSRWSAVASAAASSSPFVFVALVRILLAGFTQGYVGGFVAAGAACAPPARGRRHVLRRPRVPTETAAQVVLVYAATGALAGYARRLFVEAAAEPGLVRGPGVARSPRPTPCWPSSPRWP